MGNLKPKPIILKMGDSLLVPLAETEIAALAQGREEGKWRSFDLLEGCDKARLTVTGSGSERLS